MRFRPDEARGQGAKDLPSKDFSPHQAFEAVGVAYIKATSSNYPRRLLYTAIAAAQLQRRWHNSTNKGHLWSISCWGVDLNNKGHDDLHRVEPHG